MSYYKICTRVILMVGNLGTNGLLCIEVVDGPHQTMLCINRSYTTDCKCTHLLWYPRLNESIYPNKGVKSYLSSLKFPL